MQEHSQAVARDKLRLVECGESPGEGLKSAARGAGAGWVSRAQE